MSCKGQPDVEFCLQCDGRMFEFGLVHTKEWLESGWRVWLTFECGCEAMTDRMEGENKAPYWRERCVKHKEIEVWAKRISEVRAFGD